MGVMGMGSPVTPQDVLSSLMNDGTFNAFRSEIINQLKTNIGNPLLDFFKYFNARAEFLWSHGLISNSTYNIMKNGCNCTFYVDEHYQGTVSSTCEEAYSILSMEVSQYIDRYDVTLEICLSSLDTEKSKMLGVEGLVVLHSALGRYPRMVHFIPVEAN